MNYVARLYSEDEMRTIAWYLHLLEGAVMEETVIA